MESDLPKVLHPLRGKPLILYVIDSLRQSGVNNIITVVGYKGEMVIQETGSRVAHVWQHEQLGTGHAVMQAEQALINHRGKVIIACGDVPLIRPETFSTLIRESCKNHVKAVVLTMTLEKPEGYGRILKDDDNNFVRIVEEKDATSDEKKIKEVNTGTYVFDRDFLFDGLKRIDTNNAQGEYYLPDALNYIINSGYFVNTVLLEKPLEGSGVNTKKDLLALEEAIKQ